jgi:hypothetical protein
MQGFSYNLPKMLTSMNVIAIIVVVPKILKNGRK